MYAYSFHQWKINIRYCASTIYVYIHTHFVFNPTIALEHIVSYCWTDMAERARYSICCVGGFCDVIRIIIKGSIIKNK